MAATTTIVPQGHVMGSFFATVSAVGGGDSKRLKKRLESFKL
jgi:hypothetical protein